MKVKREAALRVAREEALEQFKLAGKEKEETTDGKSSKSVDKSQNI